MPAGILFLAFVLGLFFLATGGMKLVVSHDQGRQRIGWIADVSPVLYLAAGWLEVLGGVGLMFPTMIQAVEWLTPVAAAGLGLVMVAATGLHVRRREWPYGAGTLLLAAALASIALQPVLA